MKKNKSFIKILNKIGLRIDPWGTTPDLEKDLKEAFDIVYFNTFFPAF